MTRRLRLIALVGSLSILICALLLLQVAGDPPDEPPPAIQSHFFGPAIPPAYQLVRLEQKLPRNATLRDVLGGWGFSGQQVHRLILDVRKAHDLNRISAGRRLAVEQTADGSFRRLEYDIDESRFLVVVPDGDSYQGRVEMRRFDVVTAEVGGRIRDSLWNTLVAQGESGQLVMNIHELMQWDVDFTSIQPDDAFRLIFEKNYDQGEFVKYGEIVAMEFVHGGKSFYSFRHVDSAGKSRYYDFDGKGVKKAFLKVPFKYDYRISSGFSRSRLHPVHKVRRPHYGVDFAAPHGTPVLASAGGKVVYAGWKGAAGKLVQIRHPNGFTTSYLHLSRILVKVGQVVGQGDRIGLVGSTGVSTGPHLDYRIQDARGKYLNPRQHVAYPADSGIPADQLKQFQGRRDEMMLRLKSIPVDPVRSDGTAFAG